MTTPQKIATGGAALAALATALLVSVSPSSQLIKVAWDALPGATATGLEQSDTMPPTWRNVAEFPVTANGGSFTATVSVINGQGYWRAYTR